jgi:hypothetical protein
MPKFARSFTPFRMQIVGNAPTLSVQPGVQPQCRLKPETQMQVMKLNHRKFIDI